MDDALYTLRISHYVVHLRDEVDFGNLNQNLLSQLGRPRLQCYLSKCSNVQGLFQEDRHLLVHNVHSQ